MSRRFSESEWGITFVYLGLREARGPRSVARRRREVRSHVGRPRRPGAVGRRRRCDRNSGGAGADRRFFTRGAAALSFVLFTATLFGLPDAPSSPTSRCSEWRRPSSRSGPARSRSTAWSVVPRLTTTRRSSRPTEVEGGDRSGRLDDRVAGARADRRVAATDAAPQSLNAARSVLGNGRLDGKVPPEHALGGPQQRQGPRRVRGLGARSWDDHHEGRRPPRSPGVGKTSAAHALANDMGWETVELKTPPISAHRRRHRALRGAGRAQRHPRRAAGGGRRGRRRHGLPPARDSG